MDKGVVLSFSYNNFYIKPLNGCEILNCNLKGSFKQTKAFPVSGDIVYFQKEESSCSILRIEERKNIILRPKVANVDHVVIVQSLNFPKLKIYQIYKYIAFYNSFNVYDISIAITKSDIYEKGKNLKDLIKDGFQVYDINNDAEFKFLKNKIKNGLTVFMGQSGVGKSTLLNKINKCFKIKANEVSKKLNSGKHTTTSTKLYPYGDGYVVDTPGFSAFEINISNNEFSKCFKLFKENYNLCKFKNCIHISEKNCKIKEMLENEKISKSMYDFYKKFIQKKSNLL